MHAMTQVMHSRDARSGKGDGQQRQVVWLRYLRVLTSTETGRRSIPAKMVASVPSVVTFFTVFFIFVSIFAVLGMQASPDSQPLLTTAP